MELVLKGFPPGGGPEWGGRLGEPVRRHSRLQGRFEGGFWRPFQPKDKDRYIEAAERFEHAGKRPGARNGPLGSVALEVLRALLRLVDYRTGRLEPSITTLMSRTGRCRDAVVRALAALRRHGFLDWVRRYVPTGQTGAGPQVKQTSNAYRLSLPPAAERLLGRRWEPGPIPDDHAHALAMRQAERDAHLARTDPEERNAVLFGQGRMAEAFSRIERALQSRERESSARTASYNKSNSLSDPESA